VAVVGIVHPRLYVARTVVESCNDEELDAVIAHEAAHLKARDNLTRLLFLCAPTLFLRTFVEIEREWVRAAEEAADDRARTTTNASLALASALTKVARLASRQSAPLLHASAILSGSVVEARVRRLLDSEPEQTASFGTLRAGVGAGIGFVIGVGVFAQPWLYDVAEFCVRRLP
jgi:Zn-dependent protease with chaperone function